MRNQISLTTSSNIEGWKIEKYLGLVSTHVVAGTGVFSEFFASFSDFFGGRSGKYMQEMSHIFMEGVDDLISKARKLGGNWVIGVRSDTGEISGKNKQMLMVSLEELQYLLVL